MARNLMVGQSGGPTAVINSSLAGVYKTAKDRGFDHVYGMCYGIQGLLEGKVIDMAEQITSELELELLKNTPASFLGSCRYKLPEIGSNDSVYDKIFEILNKMDITVFIYIGGNDSMDTIKKLSDYAKKINSSIAFMGVPKTIDNDLAVTDHTPGFGSAAKFITAVTKELIRDGLVYDVENVLFIEIMGRNAGWLTGAAALAKGDDCEGVDLIYLPEVAFDVQDFLSRIHKLIKEKKNVVVAVSEGIKLADGRYVFELANENVKTDMFGHKYMGGTAKYLSELVSHEFNCKSRAVELSTIQRCAGHLVSRIDNDEAYQVGGVAVKAADKGRTGEMVILKRASEDPYISVTDFYDIHAIANMEKKVPLEWITDGGTNVSREFIYYVRPLIQGEMPSLMITGKPRHLILQ